MSSVYLVFIIVSFLFGIFAYISSNNLILGFSIAPVFALYFLIFGVRMIKKWKSEVKNHHLCFNFINSFIISLNIKKTLSGAFESNAILMNQNSEFELDSIANLTTMQKIEYLEKHFQFHIYKLFVEIIKLYDEQGGDILEMSDNLIKTTRREEEYVISIAQKSKRKLFEIVLLWVFTFLILLFVRFGLGNFFVSVTSNPFFTAAIGFFFAFNLLANEILFRTVFKSEIKVRTEYE